MEIIQITDERSYCRLCKDELNGFKYYHPECILEYVKYAGPFVVRAEDEIISCNNAYYCSAACYNTYHEYYKLIKTFNREEHKIKLYTKNEMKKALKIWNMKQLRCSKCNKVIIDLRVTGSN